MEKQITDTLVSIITPLYNGKNFVAQTIESVLAQTYADWEMIIVNDGSTDGGDAVARQFCQSDSRITLISQPNAGSAAARNNGLRRAKGRYIALLDSDDTWDPSFLESQLSLMRQHNAELVCAAHRRVDASGRECLKPFFPPRHITYADMLKSNHISCLTGLYDRKKHGTIYLNEDFRSLRDDYIFWLDVIKLTGCCIGNQQILASYRIHSSSITNKKWKMIKPQYLVYRQSEGFSIAKSLYYLFCWATCGVRKYVK